MSGEERIQLDVWRGDWGLPSVDAECLQILAYARFAGVPLQINKHSNPFRTPNGRFPVLRAGNTTLDTFSDIIAFLRTKNYTLEHQPDQCTQCGEILAYNTMIKEALGPALQFVWWIDEKNLEGLVRPWYCKAMPFPLQFYYVRKYEKEACNFFQSLYPSAEDVSVIENKVYSDAQKCMTYLSAKFENTDYFFGEQPSIVDAVLYSYLAPLLSAPLPNPALQNHLKSCTNLVKFVRRITQTYFPNDFQEYNKQKAKENAEKLAANDSDYPNKRRNQILAGIFVTLAMTGYALSTGILEVLMYLIRSRKFIKLPEKKRKRTNK